MKRLVFCSSIILAAMAYGLFISQYNIGIIDNDLNLKNPEGYYDYRGVTHSHSNLSTGSAPQNEVIESAQKAGLDFLFLTELNYLGEETRLEGYFEKLLVLQSNEYSYLDSHVLYYDHHSTSPYKGLGEVQVFLADLLSKKQSESAPGFSVLAHPFKEGYSWTREMPEGLEGVEIINLKSIWQNSWNESKISFLWSVFVYPFNPQLALIRLYLEPAREIALWDKLNEKKKVHAFLGNDSTARLASIGETYFKFPSYEDSFAIASNHVLLTSELTGDFNSDRDKIMRALRNGNFYLCLDLLGNPKGFFAEINSASRNYLPGSSITLAEARTLTIKLPKAPSVPYEIRIIKDGQLLQTYNVPEVSYAITTKGVYRVVVRVIPTFPLPDGKKWIPWIHTNAFYVN